MAASEIEISIERGDGKTLELKVNPAHMVKMVKRKIFSMTNIPISEQNLSFRGEILPDFHALKDLGIIASATFKLSTSSKSTDSEGEEQKGDVDQEPEGGMIPKDKEEKQKYVKKKIVEDQIACFSLIEQLATDLARNRENQDNDEDDDEDEDEDEDGEESN
mmetsp:Transcript_4129/g.6377  ORF Transcript_4129/g.6377 Transcript_4129/m.6377 type:complete len:162 (+) Transcript_4129:85-570(+)